MIGIIGAGLILTLPSILYGFPAGGHDRHAHLTWYIHFSEQLWAGDFYPRWLINMNSGLGSPVFFYYAPVPYYLSSLLRPFFAHDPYGWHQLGISVSLALIASGFGAYLWLKNITNRHTAFIAALLYMVMPYHVAVDLYVRAAFAEFWTFVWMPFILYFVSQIRQGHNLAIIGLAVSYALLIMTHLPTTLIFSVVPIFYSFYNVGYEQRIKTLGVTGGALILGLALSAIYLWPAMTMQAYVFIEQDRYQTLYADGYLFAKSLQMQILTNKLSLLVLGMVVLAAGAVVISGSHLIKRLNHERIFWLVVGLLSILMMTPLSKPIVWALPTLQMIQFPWRYNAVLVVATVALLAVGIYSLRQPYTPLVVILLAISGVIIVSWLFGTLWIGFQESIVDQKPVNQIIAQGIVDANYRPRWIQANIRKFAKNTAKTSIETGIGQVEIKKWMPRDIVLKINTPSGILLTIGQLYYPGWTAQIIDESCCLPIRPTQPEGLLGVAVPGGDYEVSLRLTASTSETIGQIVSAVAALVTLLLVVWFYILWPNFVAS